MSNRATSPSSSNLNSSDVIIIDESGTYDPIFIDDDHESKEEIIPNNYSDVLVVDSAGERYDRNLRTQFLNYHSTISDDDGNDHDEDDDEFGRFYRNHHYYDEDDDDEDDDDSEIYDSDPELPDNILNYLHFPGFSGMNRMYLQRSFDSERAEASNKYLTINLDNRFRLNYHPISSNNSFEGSIFCLSLFNTFIYLRQGISTCS